MAEQYKFKHQHTIHVHVSSEHDMGVVMLALHDVKGQLEWPEDLKYEVEEHGRRVAKDNRKTFDPDKAGNYKVHTFGETPDTVRVYVPNGRSIQEIIAVLSTGAELKRPEDFKCEYEEDGVFKKVTVSVLIAAMMRI